MENDGKRGPLTVASAFRALAAAVILSIALYFVVGFPANVPAAVGISVLVAEVIEAAGARAGVSAVRIVLTLFHAVLAALASWLGVEVARFFGWFG